jgi:Flp pilus assembly protein TadB
MSSAHHTSGDEERDTSGQARVWRQGYEQGFADGERHRDSPAVSLGAFAGWLLAQRRHPLAWLGFALVAVVVAFAVFTVIHYLWLIALAFLIVAGIELALHQRQRAQLRQRLH